MFILETIIKVSNVHDYYDWIMLVLTIMIPIITSFINVVFVNINTNKQIANQNKQTYRPRIIVSNVLNSIVDYNCKILFVRTSSRTKNKKIDFHIDLKNIGNGIASDICFYSLDTGRKCTGYQFNDIKKNQKLECVREISPNDIDTFNFNAEYEIKYKNEEIVKNRDALLLLCSYKDLNHNNYSIIIGIVVKESSTTTKFDYYYYHSDTKEYMDIIKEYRYKENYNKIIKEISKK